MALRTALAASFRRAVTRAGSAPIVASRSMGVAMTAEDLKDESPLTQEYIKRELKFGAFNYAPVPVVLTRGQGVHVFDVDGKRYYDFLSAYSAVNQGHCHPRIIAAMIEQAQKLTLTSRAFYNDALGEFEEYMCTLFGYDRVLPMNTGVEAWETGVKLARRWGHEVKRIPDGQAKVVFARDAFHGRSIAAMSASTDPESYGGYGPLVPLMPKIAFNDLAALEAAVRDPHVAAFVVEPIQGEAGVIVPDTGYMAKAHAICRAHNVLLVADEVQTGIGRTGKLLACDHDGVRPDILCLGKALSGGVMPVSAVLARDEIMLTVKPGQHGSTFGGNPLACRVAIAAMDALQDEGMIDNAAALGEVLRAELRAIPSPRVATVRGRGLLNAIVVRAMDGVTAYEVCLKMRDLGLLAKPTRKDTIRLAPPLVMTRDQLLECADIITRSFAAFD